ncbi:MAG: methyltransferase domain-containing protein [Bacteroidota bacterium]
MKPPSHSTAKQQADRIQNYYTFQSKIYDLTRWSFLFGRKGILQHLPFAHEETFHLLEVGCGTGHNLARVRKFYPEAQLTGMDVSKDMLGIARRKFANQESVILLEQPYERKFYSWTGKLDAILFSYSLTMINPQWQELIQQAYKDLRPGGVIAVADFHDSNWPGFKRHMGGHHVRMDGHLLPVLASNFQTVVAQVSDAYLGVWEYLLYVGKKI